MSACRDLLLAVTHGGARAAGPSVADMTIKLRDGRVITVPGIGPGDVDPMGFSANDAATAAPLMSAPTATSSCRAGRRSRSRTATSSRSMPAITATTSRRGPPATSSSAASARPSPSRRRRRQKRSQHHAEQQGLPCHPVNMPYPSDSAKAGEHGFRLFRQIEARPGAAQGFHCRADRAAPGRL